MLTLPLSGLWTYISMLVNEQGLMLLSHKHLNFLAQTIFFCQFSSCFFNRLRFILIYDSILLLHVISFDHSKIPFLSAKDLITSLTTLKHLPV